MILKKIFFNLINNAVFGKTMENMRKHRDIRLVTERINKKQFGDKTDSSCYQVIHRIFISNRNEKNLILINKPVYLGHLIHN